MTRPDRFEKLADNLRLEMIASPWATQVQSECWPGLTSRIAKLLRQEHAWMRRMVMKVKDWSEQELTESDDVIAAILDQLTQRRK